MDSYTYDADSNRVKKTVGSTNFYYPFPTYEISGTVAIKYYFFLRPSLLETVFAGEEQ